MSLWELATVHNGSLPTAAALEDSSALMDDFATGAEDIIDVITTYYQLTSFLGKISLPLGKLASNWEPLRNKWSQWLRNQIHDPGTRIELGNLTGYPLHGSQRRHREDADGADNEETTPSSNLKIL
jgi:hypothetical protein